MALLCAIPHAVEVDLQHPGFCQEYKLIISEAEVGNTSGHHDFPNEVPTWCPHIQTISTATVDVAIPVQLDAIRDACKDATL